MRLPILLLLLLATGTLITAQNKKKILFGSFVFENQVFQYEYKRDANIHSLRLSTLAQPNPAIDLDIAKLFKTEDYINTVTKKDSSKNAKNRSEFLKNASDGTLDTIAMLPEYISALRNIIDSRSKWKEQSSVIPDLIQIFEKYNIENMTFADSVVKGIYKITDLLLIYQSFLQNAAEPQTSQEIPFPELKENEFKVIFSKELGQLYQKNNQPFDKLSQKVADIGIEIMYEIKARADFKDDEPVTAYMTLKRKYIDIDISLPVCPKCYPKTKHKIPVRFEIKNVIIEFEDGGIKNIFADLLPLVKEYTQVYGSNTVRFRNNKPISIAGKFDPDEFRKHRIFSGNNLELITTLYNETNRQLPNLKYSKGDFKDAASDMKACFILSNILDYRIVSETDNEDYSPANGKIELDEPSAIVELKKEKRSRILSARVYSDFMGLNDEQPNGLVQIEVSKKVNIISGRKQGILFWGKGNSKGIYSGALTFIEPRFTISKIEENNRYLKLDSLQINKVKSLVDSSNYFFINPLEVIRYQQWSFGLDVNLFKLNLHNRKSNFQINGSFTYGRTSVADSIKITQNKITQIESRNISRINTTVYGFSIMYEVKPDSRYGFSLGYDVKWMDLLNNHFEYSKEFTNTYHSAWFNGFFKINEDSKMFWRFRKNWLSGNPRSNFYQIQIGYELDIFKSTK